VICAPAVEGKANAAVVLALAEAFGVARSKVAIVRGETARCKTVRIEGATLASLRDLLES